MNKRDKEAAIKAVGRSRSCATCRARFSGAHICKICFNESVKSFGKGIAYERKRRKNEEAITTDRIEMEMRVAFGARARIIDGERYVTLDWQGFQNIVDDFIKLGRNAK